MEGGWHCAIVCLKLKLLRSFGQAFRCLLEAPPCQHKLARIRRRQPMRMYGASTTHTTYVLLVGLDDG